MIRDQASFHPRPDDPALTERIHVPALPPYSPELNPDEKLWDMAKDVIANTVFDRLSKL